MLTAQSADYVRLTPMEIAMGLPLAERGERLPQPELPARSATARLALREVLRGILTSGQVFVSFSGGRDSSAVLAASVSVARELGAELPVPITYRYPGDQDADEHEWQELVLEHLGVTERIVLDITDQQRLLGERAKESMAGRGLIFPAAANLQSEMFSIASGSVLLTGEGGDELFVGRRTAPIARLVGTVRQRHRPSRAVLRSVGRPLLPQTRRLQSEVVRLQSTLAPWLLDTAREEFSRILVEDLAEPIRWGRAIRKVSQRPLVKAIYHNMDLVARDYNVRYLHPLLAPEFVSAWIGDGGRFGVTDRTAAMRQLFDDVLPDPILARSSKSFFNASRFGEGERDFARRWDGQGLEPEYTDADILRETWLTGEYIGNSATALMAAWMASEGLPLEGPRR